MLDPRDALDAIGTLPDTEIDIGDAALQFARIDAPDADWEAARAHLSELARAASGLADTIDESDLAARAVGLSGVAGWPVSAIAATNETYDDLVNANLIRVIERRRGLPVALGVLWLHTAHAAGWAAHGVDFPAHFLVAMPGAGGQSVLDVFHGGTPLTSKDLRALLKQVEGDSAELRPGLVAADEFAPGAAAAAEQHPDAAADGQRPGRRAGLRRGHAADRAGSRQPVAAGGAAEPETRPDRGGVALFRSLSRAGAGRRGGARGAGHRRKPCEGG